MVVLSERKCWPKMMLNGLLPTRVVVLMGMSGDYDGDWIERKYRSIVVTDER